MAEEIVTIKADGRTWTAVDHITVGAHFRHAARSFFFRIAAEIGPTATAWVFKAGTEIEIYFNADLVVRGFVDRYQPRIAGKRRADVSISGRSRAQDFIDSSAVHPTGEFKNKTVAEIAQALDKFNVGIITDQTLPKIPICRITPGESNHAVVEKLARQAGVWPSGQADGSINLTIAGAGRNAPLIEGHNVLEADADHNWAGRHSHVIVRGQRAVGHGASSLEVEETARDPSLRRYRPVVVVRDDDTDKSRAKKAAHHRRDCEVGNSLKAHVTTQGFRDDKGALWTPGFLTFSDIPFLDITQDMAIDAVVFTQSRSSGSRTRLTLVDPRALGGKGNKGGKAGKAWSNGAGVSYAPDDI